MIRKHLFFTCHALHAVIHYSCWQLNWLWGYQDREVKELRSGGISPPPRGGCSQPRGRGHPRPNTSSPLKRLQFRRGIQAGFTSRLSPVILLAIPARYEQAPAGERRSLRMFSP